MIDLTTYCAEFGVALESLRARGLSPFAEAGSLEIAEVGDDGREHRLVPPAAKAWRALKAEAARDGEGLFIVSAYRSVERQAEIIRAKLRRGQSIEEILSVSAFPGFSEHHTGRAVDLSTSGRKPLDVDFELSSVYDWLSDHAARFGFRLSYPKGNALGYQYEPWHWCFEEKNRCFEEKI